MVDMIHMVAALEVVNEARQAHPDRFSQEYALGKQVVELRTALAEAQRELEELRADLVWAVMHDAGLEGSEDGPSVCYYGTQSIASAKFAAFDGTDADLCRAIREARRGE